MVLLLPFPCCTQQWGLEHQGLAGNFIFLFKHSLRGSVWRYGLWLVATSQHWYSPSKRKDDLKLSTAEQIGSDWHLYQACLFIKNIDIAAATTTTTTTTITIFIWNISVRTMIAVGCLIWESVVQFQKGTEIYFLFMTSTPALESTQPYIWSLLAVIFSGLKWPERESDQLPLSAADVKNCWSNSLSYSLLLS
jgi:hypothetical protein